MQPRRLIAPFFLGAGLVLIPWTIWLTLALPAHHESENWRTVWVGFDLFEAAALITTAVTALRRSPWLAPVAAIAGTLLCVDAWFDVTLEAGGRHLLSVERTSEFRGLYHVLGGALSPLDGVEPEHLRIDELFGRVERNGVQEVVLATNPNMTGEATAAYLADRLRGRVRVTRLASGLPVGGDLEYADEVTLGRALTGRREM